MKDVFVWNWGACETWDNHGEYGTREEAIQAARAETDLSKPFHFQTAKKQAVDVVAAMPDATDFIEHMQEQMYEQAGEACEDWISTTAAKEKELTDDVQKIILAWLKKHDQMPDFWTMTEIQDHRTT